MNCKKRLIAAFGSGIILGVLSEIYQIDYLSMTIIGVILGIVIPFIIKEDK